jgi:oligopeptide transport system substrate-binding protein
MLACSITLIFSFALQSFVSFASPARVQAQSADFRMIIGEPLSLDPNIITDFSIFTTSQLFDPLYRINADGTEQWLGATGYDVSEDGLVWTYHLNPNAKWSDGTPITADDWAFSWLRILDPTLGGGVAYFLSAIKGANDYNAGTITDPTQVGVRAVDPLTFEVTMAQPSPQFRAVAALPYITAVPKHVVEAAGEGWIEAGTLVSSGPYKLESWKHDQEIVLVANEFYGGTAPTIQRAVLTITSGDLCTAQIQAYEADEIDFVTCVPSQDIARVREQYADEFSLQALSATLWVQFDNRNPIFSDVRVRKAMSLAVDRQAMVDALTDGTSFPAPVHVPAGVVGNNPADAAAGTLDEAKQLMADAGYADGAGFPEFTITTTSARGRKEIAELLQQMWKTNLGLTVNVEVLEENAFRTWLNDRKTEPYDMAVSGWYTDYEDPNNWFKEVFVDDYRNMHFTNQEFLDLVAAGAYELDPAKREQTFLAANKILETEIPSIPLYYVTDIQLRKPWVKNLGHTPVLGLYFIGEASLDPH